MKELKQKEKIETIIQANNNWFYIDWKGLWDHRDLLFLLVRRDFISKYKQTILGPLWFILQPLMTTVAFTLIFSKGLKVSTDGIPPLLFYLCAMAPWSYFATSVSSVSTSLIGNANLFQKVYFPRLIIPLSITLSNLITFAIQFVTFACFYIYFKYAMSAGATINLNGSILALPLFLLQTIATCLGVGLWVTALTVKYRDFQYLVGFMVQLWMYATPIIYPASAIPEKFRIILALNPMSGVIEHFRYAFFGQGIIDFKYSCISFSISILLFITGALVFNKVERTFVDTI